MLGELLERGVGLKALSVDQFARAVGIGRSLAWEAVWSGKVRSCRLGKRVLIPVSAIQDFLDSAETASKVAG